MLYLLYYIRARGELRPHQMVVSFRVDGTVGIYFFIITTCKQISPIASYITILNFPGRILFGMVLNGLFPRLTFKVVDGSRFMSADFDRQQSLLLGLG